QKSIAGCDLPVSSTPKPTLEVLVAEGFRAEHAVKDPSDLGELDRLFAKGRAVAFWDIADWFSARQDIPDLTVRGLTMYQWESFLTAAEFTHQPDVYPAACAGWTFEGYLQKHPEVDKAYVEAKIAAYKP